MLTNSNKSPSSHDSHTPYWILLCVIIIVALIRVRLLGFPLERDEGEYAYCGQLILQLIPPFKAAYSMKLPGTGFAYSVLMLLFGQTIEGIHLGLLIINCLSIILLFLIAKKLLNPEAALIASSIFAVFSLSPTVLGFAAHATHFIILFALGGTLLLLLCLKNGRLILFLGSGFLFGLAFLMKQHGFFFILFGGYLILQAGLSSKPVSLKFLVLRLLIFSGGAIIPLILALAVAWLSGSLDKFWFWIIKYPSNYASLVPLSEAFNIFINSFLGVVQGFELLWLMAIIGLPALFLDKRFMDVRWFILAFTLFSFLAVCPGFYFREHYFIVFLPAAGLLIGIAINSLQHYLSHKFSNKFLQYFPILFLLSAVALGINAHKNYFLLEKPAVLCRAIYGANPFIESIKIGDFIKSKSNHDDKIAVLGSEPEILFYSHRKSATGYIYTYGLMETHGYQLTMQREMIKEIELAAPKYLVFIKIVTSWLVQPESEKLIFNWFYSYAQRYYELAGVIDIISPQETRYIWGDEAKTYKNKSPSFILIFERRQFQN